MLILTRKTGEVIVINGDIKVTVLDIRGREVRIGIDAPISCPIDRQEVADRKAAGRPWMPKI